MSRKDDMIAALECRVPRGTVPVWELEFHLWNKFSEKHFTVGVEFEKLTGKQKDRALHINAEIMAEVSALLHFGAVTIPGGYWEISPGHPAYYWLPDEDRLKQAEILVRHMNSQVMLVASTGGVMAIPEADEFTDFIRTMYESPEEIDQRARRIYDHGIECFKKFRDRGIQAFFTASDIAMNSGPFFPPAEFERFILPFLQQWAGFVRDHDAYAILHSDGDLNMYLPHIAASGIHALQAIDPVAGMDIFRVKKEFGDRLCLCGNIDCGLIIRGRIEDIYDGTKKLLLKCKTGGGFVLGASNAVEVDAATDNYKAIIRAWEQYGIYN
jgi:uroporphyrinogen decarboxylase